jgi:hypothetical protein
MRTLRSILIVLSLAAAACAPRNPFEGRPFAPGEASVLQVTNNNWSTVIVYCLMDGGQFRLGSVETGMSTTLRLPAAVVATGDLELRVYAIASRAVYESGPIMFAAGETIDLVVENTIELSTYYVYQ